MSAGKGKRKRSGSKEAQGARGKSLRKLLLSDHAAWKKVDLPYGVHAVGSSSEVGLFSLEELNPAELGIAVETAGAPPRKPWGDSEDSDESGGHVVAAKKPKKRKKKKSKPKPNPKESVKTSAVDDSGETKGGETVFAVAPVDDADIPEEERWESLPLSESLIKSLKANGFAQPTPIQRKTIPAALTRKRDIIGAAETGSGKTLAFGIPIIEQIYANMRQRQRNKTVQKRDERTMKALVLVPTRELCVQVGNMLRVVAAKLGISVISIFGGMALPKQRRLLGKRPDIVVATPGRYWDLYGEGDPFLSTITDLKYLVIDEADRMIESGYFKELYHILSTLDLTSTPIDALAADTGEVKNIESDPDEAGESSAGDVDTRRQTFVFSATLTLSRQGRKDITKKKQGKQKQFTGVALLVSRIDFQRKKAVIDLTSQDVAKTLKETMIECTLNEKDYYLFYILRAHPGRTLIFVNSIDCVRRLLPLFKLFDMPVWALHASMQQRQRLKNMDRFQANANCALIATDVAARGLDIPNIDHVVHYQLPRTTELYIHRSGRTARASRSGVSVMLVSPKEVTLYKNICFILGRENGLPEFEVERSFMPKIRSLFDIAREIDHLEHADRKKKANREWFLKNAEAADIVLDEDLLDDEPDDEIAARASKKTRKKLEALHRQLKFELKTHIEPEGTGYAPLGFVSTEQLHEVMTAGIAGGKTRKRKVR